MTVNNWKRQYLDEYTQDTMPIDLMQDAMMDEIRYFADNVIEVVDVSEMKDYADSKLLG